MKMHEKLQANAPEPRNQVRCGLRVSLNEQSPEPIQLWFNNTLRTQGIFLTEQDARDLIIALQITLDEMV